MRADRLHQKETLLIIENPLDIFYLTGEKVSKGTLLLFPNETILLVDHRYLEAVANNPKLTVLAHTREEEALRSENIQTVVLAGNTLTYEQFSKWEKRFSDKKIENRNATRTARLVKDPQEIKAMQASARLNKEAMERIMQELEEGISEEEVAWQFEKYARERGATAMAFSPHIVFGKNTSRPHHQSGKTTLKKNSPVTIDTGVVVDGYTSDRTRSFLFKGKNPEYEDLLSLVMEAHDRVVKEIQIGVSLRHLVMVVDQFFEEKGVKKYCKHSLGHSLGLEVHEYPTLSLAIDQDLVCQEGMVLAIEPGLYKDGLFGVRHENTILMTAKGAKIL